MLALFLLITTATALGQILGSYLYWRYLDNVADEDFSEGSIDRD